MGTKKKNFLSIFLMGILLVTMISPAYAEVQSLQTDSLFYKKGDEINFYGTVDDESTGLVTIVIRDTNDKFVLLTQGLINPDNTFKRSVSTNEKFTAHGIYNATAFLVNMTEGVLTRFDFSVDGSPVNPSVSNMQKETQQEEQHQDSVAITQEPEPIVVKQEPVPVSKIASFVDPTKDPQYYIDRYNNEIAYKDWFDKNFPGLTIEEAVGVEIGNTPKQSSIIPGFPDPNKDPQYYIDRYNNESTYREWFDRNFPDQTVYDVVGIPNPELYDKSIENTTEKIIESTQELSPTMIESSTVSPTTNSENNELGQMLLALGGLGVLFGAVYGVKRKVDNNSEQITTNNTILQKKVDNNSEQISQNKFWLKNKLMKLKSTENPVDVIKERLAKGEITVEQYYKLLRALKK